MYFVASSASYLGRSSVEAFQPMSIILELDVLCIGKINFQD
jgi:hypothetical protein